MENPKHKIKIENYNGDLDQLVIEIGDLRYDVLEKFLSKLSNKIKEDGIKDESRGRVRLAKCLNLTSKELINGSKNIQEAWAISEPFMYVKDIRKKIQEEFEENDRKEVFRNLSKYCYDWDETSNFKLARCLLYGTDGDINKFRQNIEYFKADPRDVIAQAEYDKDMNWLRNFNRPYGKEKIRKEDFEKKDKMIEKNESDNLPF
jgi:hypothetical protein